MARIVKKFGGTSVGDVDRIKNVANIIKEDVEQGHQVAVVVSARSGVTNELIARAKAINEQPDDREMDVLLAVGEQETIALTAMALHALGVEAISMTGAQAGIKTDPAHTRARIVSMNCERIEEALEKGSVVIVAGFQGVNAEGTTTTLGRGGSDLSAIALASGLKADLCQIYTDVDGVYTADPRIVPKASKIPEISYEEMLEMASLGTKVMQARSVEFANKFNVVFEVRSSFDTSIPGTIVKQEVSSMEDVVVRGVALDRNQAKIMVSNIPDKPGSAAQIFEALGKANVCVDMIVQNIGRNGVANLTFTVTRDDSKRSLDAVEKVLNELGGGEVAVFGEVVKLSVVGIGMRSHSGVASKLFAALAEAKSNIQIISTSEIKISVVIDEEGADDAVRVVHSAFGLDKLDA
ncbi:aspartate kinase [Pelagicoccus sp. NFK12]|uniref:Aspartokinase n=1 Tax=Pelagicoccus enzymogenes TaxID=2773457 RepID=A0A927F970_9BACT|nr:aspartate kinase [Pelagicoccus enzymogenes]MBD5780175.1 aspartate kinase [Pelagicoccus enzymogenes]MDQ8198562.1 aspartate kinase [Pelagicoccus enzymogenes]